MNELDILKRKLERERLARKQAEAILEKKALELYKLNEQLEVKIAERTEELKISEEKYRGIIENMELGLLEVDKEQNIIRAYDWFCDMTGYTEAEMLGKNAPEFLLSDFDKQTLMETENNRRKQGQAGIYEVKIKHKDGHDMWMLISGSPVVDINGNVTGSIGIHYDITQRKILEEDLIEAKRSAELAQEAEKLFLANMSHEIRTPLNAIIGMSHLLKDSNPTNEQLEYLSILSKSSHILKLLISDILDFSKIDSGEIEIRISEFDIWQVIENLHKTIQLRVEEKEILVSFEIDTRINHYVLGDQLLLNQILINLLGNANKFTDEGEIRIVVSMLDGEKEEEEEMTLQFQIIDTGIGIPNDQQKLIFENFKQVEQHEKRDILKKSKGTGLGLAITKQLVELQNGRIYVESEVGKGTTFTFEITYQKSKPIKLKNPEKISINEVPNFQGNDILVVEDNYMNQKYIATLLNKWNINFEFANDGAIALEKTFVKSYDLIFMDLSMPNMNGFDATKAIRNTENLNQDKPIIALSALAFKHERKRAMDMGMTDFLGKPFSPNGLMNVLDLYLERTLIDHSVQEKNNNKSYFNSNLDVSHLTNLYEDDYEYAFEMFDLFLEFSIPAFEEIRETIEKGDFENVKLQAHKLKPNFSMVGLLNLRNEMEKLENISIQTKEISTIFDLYESIEQKLNKALAHVKETHEKLNPNNY